MAAARGTGTLLAYLGAAALSRDQRLFIRDPEARQQSGDGCVMNLTPLSIGQHINPSSIYL